MVGMPGISRRQVLGSATAAALALALTACGGSGSSPSGVDKDGVVTISVNGMPAKTQAVDRANFLEDVKVFEKSHPKIRIDAREGQMDPKTFAAKLAGGQLEDVYYVYFTDPAGLIQRRRAADISKYVGEVPFFEDIDPALMKVFKDSRRPDVRTAHRQLLARSSLQPGAVHQGRTRPREAAGHLGGGPHRREEDQCAR